MRRAGQWRGRRRRRGGTDWASMCCHQGMASGPVETLSILSTSPDSGVSQAINRGSSAELTYSLDSLRRDEIRAPKRLQRNLVFGYAAAGRTAEPVE